MAELGTLEFAVKLRDETQRQAEEIKSELLTKLQLDYDKESYTNMINGIKSALDKETFQIKIDTNLNAAKQAVQNTFDNIVGGNRVMPTIDLSGLKGSDAFTRDIIELQRHIYALNQDVAEYKKRWQQVSDVYGRNSDEAKRAANLYLQQKQILEDQKNKLAALRFEQREYNLGVRETNRVEKEAAKSAKETEKAQRDATRAEEERREGHVRLSGELMKGIRISTDLQDAFTSLYSVHMMKEFLGNVIEIGGQLEKQRVSMRAILGDTAKADVLFEQIKGLAVKSPFGVVELDQYTKQLAAYGFEYNELFDMIKRLADISAGAGQDISRLTLALGHVKAQTYLTGYTMRQFSMNNIPMLKMLAEYYEEIEGHAVTVADVQERISKHQVSYEDVIEQIRRLTDVGGRFYKQQEVQSETVGAKWKNLKDALDIMYGDLAEGVIGDSLKALADLLTTIALNGEKLITVVGTLTATYATYKAVLVAIYMYEKLRLAINNTVMILQMVKAMQGLTVATKAQTLAQGALNAVMSWNWLAIGVGAIALLATRFFSLGEETKTLEEEMIDLNKAFEKQEADIKKDEAAARNYVKVMTNVDNSMSKRIEAYRELQSLYPKYLENLTQEKALLLNTADALSIVSGASKQKRVDMAQEIYDNYNINLLEAKKALAELKDKGVEMQDENFNPIFIPASQEQIKNAESAVEKAKELADKALDNLNDIKAENDAILENMAARWHKESKEMAGDFKDLFPKDDESRSEYFNRIYSEISSLDSQIKILDKHSEKAQEVLPELSNKYSAAVNIFTKALGGVLNNTKIDKDAEKAKRDAEKVMEEKLRLALKDISEFIKEEGSKYNLYKEILEATGNSEAAVMMAFKGNKVFETLAEELRVKLGEALKEAEIDKSIGEVLNMNEIELNDIGISDKTVAHKLIESIKQEEQSLASDNVKLWIEAYKNAHEYDLELEKINVKYDNMRKATEAMRESVGDEKTDQILVGIDKSEAKETSDLLWKQFKETEEWGRVFSDLDNMSSTTLNNMLNKLRDYAPTVEGSVESTKALYEAMQKISDLLQDRNPFASLVDSLRSASRLREEISRYQSFDPYHQITFSAAKAGQLGLTDGTKEWKGTLTELRDNLQNAENKFVKSISGIANKFKAVQDVLQPVIDLFEQLGNTTLSDLFKMGSNAIGSAASVASGIQSIQGLFNEDSPIYDAIGKAGPWGAAVGAGLSLISSISAMHDASLQKEIEASEARQNEMENLSKNLETVLDRAINGILGTKADGNTLSKLAYYAEKYAAANKANPKTSSQFMDKLNFSYISRETNNAVKQALQSKNYYDSVYASMLAQRDELAHQLELEKDKKKSDKSKIADFEQAMTEINDQIKYFATDMMKDLYEIDFKSWAQSLSEVLVDAWASGEDAAESYRDKVSEILRDLGVKMIAERFVADKLNPIMEQFIRQYEQDKGVLTTDGMAILGGMYDAAYELQEQTTNFLNGLNEVAMQHGEELKETNSTSSGLSKSIEGVTESTADLLASYLNATRADVSLIAMNIPIQNGLAQSQVQHLESIARHTEAIERHTATMEVYLQNQDGIHRYVKGIADGTYKIRV